MASVWILPTPGQQDHIFTGYVFLLFPVGDLQPYNLATVLLEAIKLICQNYDFFPHSAASKSVLAVLCLCLDISLLCSL